MSFSSDIVLAPQEVRVGFAIEEVYNVLSSMMILSNVPFRSGFGRWVEQTAQQLSPQQEHFNRAVFWGMGVEALLTVARSEADFPTYLDSLAAQESLELRDHIAEQMCFVANRKFDSEETLTPQALLDDREGYLALVERALALHDEQTDLAPFRALHELLGQPQLLHQTLLEHLTNLWQTWLKAEWQARLPRLQQTVAAFEGLDHSGLTAVEAMRAVTGRDLSAVIAADEISAVARVVFVPSPHGGPYVAWRVEGSLLHLLFTERLPAVSIGGASQLSEAELLMVLNALDNEVRLGIVRLLGRHDELCSQDIIDRFNLS